MGKNNTDQQQHQRRREKKYNIEFTFSRSIRRDTAWKKRMSCESVGVAMRLFEQIKRPTWYILDKWIAPNRDKSNTKINNNNKKWTTKYFVWNLRMMMMIAHWDTRSLCGQKDKLHTISSHGFWLCTMYIFPSKYFNVKDSEFFHKYWLTTD